MSPDARILLAKTDKAIANVMRFTEGVDRKAYCANTGRQPVASRISAPGALELCDEQGGCETMAGRKPRD